MMMIPHLSWTRKGTNGSTVQTGQGGEGAGAASEVASHPAMTLDEPSTNAPPLANEYDDAARRREEETLGPLGFGVPILPEQETRLPQPSSHQGIQKCHAGHEQNKERIIEPQVVIRHEIEILPGFTLTLRGADETYAAHQRNQCTTVTCVGCYKTVACIRDADYVLCPACKVMSPLEVVPSADSSGSRVGGLGLGFIVGGSSGSAWCHNGVLQPTWS